MKTKNVRLIHVIEIVVLGLILMLGGQVRSQVIESRKDAFSSIPPEERAKLFERLRLLVKAQSERRWNDVYDMSLNAIEGSLTRAAFMKDHENGFPDRHAFELLSFTPTAATVVNMNGDSKEWLIEGCAQYREMRKIGYWRAGLNARLYQGQWYFSYLSELTNGADGPPLPCAHHTRTHGPKGKWRRGS